MLFLLHSVPPPPPRNDANQDPGEGELDKRLAAATATGYAVDSGREKPKKNLREF